MSDAERVVEVKRLVEHWLPHMGLENWRIFVRLAERKDKLDANAMLTIRIDGAGYQRASILVAPNLPEERWGVDLERDVVHELCHIPLDKTDDVAWAAGEIWQKAYRKAEEGVIDQFAAMLTRLHVGAVTLDIPKAGSAGPVFERSRARTVKEQERLESAFNHRLANVSQGARRAQAWRKKQKREQQAAG